MTADFNNDSPIPPEINKYLAILSKDPGSMVFAPLAEAYRRARMLDEAIATAKDGLDIHPNYVSGMVALGRAYFDKGMIAEAKETLGKVLVIVPDNIIAANVLQEIKQKIGDKVYGNTYVPKPDAIATPAPAPPTGPEQPFSPGGEGDWLGLEEDLEVIEALDLEELIEVEEGEDAGVEAGEKAEQAYGEEISEELWTGETVHEAPEVEEEASPKREITTSTIAELYIRQGYLDKAIDIYQTLHDANPYDGEIKKKLDELKKQSGVKVEAGRVEAPIGEPEFTSNEKQYAADEIKPGEQESSVEENKKRLENWLKTIQSEKRKA